MDQKRGSAECSTTIEALLMKTRKDFVSNSSSCSFIVEDLTSMVKTLKETFGDDISIPWNINDEISFCLYSSRRNLEELAENIEINKNYINHCFGSSNDDLYELDCISFSSFLVISNDLLKKCKYVLISCDNTYPNSVFIVKMLRIFFKNQGINIKDNSDIDFDLDMNDFMVKLIYETYKKWKPNEEK